MLLRDVRSQGRSDGGFRMFVRVCVIACRARFDVLGEIRFQFIPLCWCERCENVCGGGAYIFLGLILANSW